jgi:uncharacterized coiled-coil protein SlyX
MQLDGRMQQLDERRAEVEEALGKIQGHVMGHRVARSRIQNKIKQLDRKILVYASRALLGS